jgi:hypothetical protein
VRMIAPRTTTVVCFPTTTTATTTATSNTTTTHSSFLLGFIVSWVEALKVSQKFLVRKVSLYSNSTIDLRGDAAEPEPCRALASSSCLLSMVCFCHDNCEFHAGNNDHRVLLLLLLLLMVAPPILPRVYQKRSLSN